MPTPTVDSLLSTLKNTSGVEAPFGYIPPHGRRLAPNETITVFGNIVDRVARRGERYVRALQRDLLSGAITIIATPSQVFDQGGAPKVISDTAGTLGTVDPSWA
jgi:hypothetical protein